MREVADRARIEAFMTALAREATADVNVFHVGGTPAVLLGWRDTMMDLDLAVRSVILTCTRRRWPRLSVGTRVIGRMFAPWWNAAWSIRTKRVRTLLGWNRICIDSQPATPRRFAAP